ncbi:MAG: hypothetical protein H0V18_16490, partial [Pyrinomonadaceae bacterium]|nr:hypothetical protein [Pyrinomonadaceae bacterium]
MSGEDDVPSQPGSSPIAGLGDLGLPPRGEEVFSPVRRAGRPSTDSAGPHGKPPLRSRQLDSPGAYVGGSPQPGGAEAQIRAQSVGQLVNLLAAERSRRQSARPLSAGESYTLARWRELCDETAPWWVRSDGIGLRLRLLELLSLADARREGALRDPPIAKLISQGEKAVGQATGLLFVRYQKWAEAMKAALKARPENWHPAGQAHALAESTLAMLEEPEYFTAMLQLLEQRAREVDVSELEQLDELIELFDAELALEGHSSAWRLRLVGQTERDLEAGRTFAEAADAAMRRLRRGVLRPMQVLFRLTARESALEQQATIKLPYHAGKALDQLIAGWDADLSDDVDFEHGAIVLELEDAADPVAAALRAERWLSRLMAQWSLEHDGPLSLNPTVWVYDSGGPRVQVFRRRAPLQLMPEGLVRHQERLRAEARREPSRRRSRAANEQEEQADPLAEALMQLAQARLGTAGSALTDLWMVAEALFAGVAAEPKHNAADVMSACLQPRYIRDALGWLTDELEHAGDSAHGADGRAMWALRRLHDDLDGVRALLADRPLAMARANRMASWLDGTALQEDLGHLKERCIGVADRAYLVRNFFVHAAQPERAAALDATLMPFAGMVRTALGLVASDERPPLISSQSAALQAEQLAHNLAGGEIARSQAVRAFELALDLR